MGIIIGGTIGFFAILLGLAVWADSATCHNRWSAEFKPQYGVFAGCTVQTKEGRIPEKNYRVF